MDRSETTGTGATGTRLGPVTTPTDADPARIAARYPARPARHHAYQALALVLAVVLLGWMTWAGVRKSNPPVTADVHGFTVVDDHTIRATLRVQRANPARPAICTLQATAENFVQVGERDQTIAGGTQKITMANVEVRTLTRAATITVKGCRAA